VRPASRAPPPHWPPAARAACRSGSTRWPLRDASLGPAEILIIESQELMMAIGTPERRAGRSCHLRPVGRALHGHREVTETRARLEMTLHGEPVVDIPARQRGRLRPGLTTGPAPPARAAMDVLAADDPALWARPLPEPWLRRPASLLAVPEAAPSSDLFTGSTTGYVLGDTCCPCRRRRRRADRTRRPASASRGHRRQRGGTACSTPVAGTASWRWPDGLTQRTVGPSPAPSRWQVTHFLNFRGPGGPDCEALGCSSPMTRRGLVGRLPAPRAPGPSRRANVIFYNDRRRRHSPHCRSSGVCWVSTISPFGALVSLPDLGRPGTRAAPLGSTPLGAGGSLWGAYGPRSPGRAAAPV